MARKFKKTKKPAPRKTITLAFEGPRDYVNRMAERLNSNPAIDENADVVWDGLVWCAIITTSPPASLEILRDYPGWKIVHVKGAPRSKKKRKMRQEPKSQSVKTWIGGLPSSGKKRR